MNTSPQDLDWNHIKSFLHVVDAGNLSQAAKRLGSTQPTIGRQISALEDALGFPLFDRAGHKLALNARGEKLAAHWRPMLDISFEAELVAKGNAPVLGGQVVVTVTDLVGRYAMPEVVKRVREQAPDIQILVQVTDNLQNISKREADIAVRNLRPDQNTLIAKKIKSAKAYLYASRDYIKAHGAPANLDELSAHSFVAFDNAEMMSKEMNKRGLRISPSQFVTTSNDSNTVWAMVEAGLAIGIMVYYVGENAPWAERLLPAFEGIDFDMWITTHQELRNSPSIRLVFDVMSEVVPRYL